MNTEFDPERLRTAPYPHDGHLDGDADGLGAARGFFFSMAIMGAVGLFIALLVAIF